MTDELDTTTLAAITTDISYGFTASATDEPAGPKFLRITDIQNGTVDWDSVPFCSISSSNVDKYALKIGDIVVARTGNSTGENYVYSGSETTAIFASYLIRFRINTKLADPWYVWYCMRTRRWWDFIRSVKTGSAQAGANAKVLGQFELNLPSLERQADIAALFRLMDNKIELNRQTNQTLESMAQALFKSWFVDFDPVIDNALAAGNEIPEPLAAKAAARRALQEQGTDKANQRHTLPDHIRQLFPSRFQFTEELGWIPEGWDVKRADEISNVSIGRTPPRKEAQWFSDHQTGNIPWLSIRDLGSHSIFYADSSEYLTHEAVEQFNVKTIPAGTVVLSFKLTLGRIGIAAHTLTTNEAIAHFCESTLPKEFLYSYLKVFDFSSLGSTSSIATAVNSKIIKAMPFLVPPQRAIESFSSIVRSMFNKAYELERQTRSLMETRDTLLPKLLSGELRIPETKKELDEALA